MIRKFSEIEVGSELDVEVLLLSSEVKQGKAGNYTLLVVSDGENKYNVRFWGDISTIEGISDKSVITVTLKVDSYQGSTNYTSRAIAPYTGVEAKMEDFIVTPPVDIDEMYNYIIGALNEVAAEASAKVYTSSGKNEPIANIALSLIQNNADAFKRSVAAVNVHHNIYGGLLFHTYGMVKLAQGMASALPNIDKELLVAGCAIHDIGKICMTDRCLADMGDLTLQEKEFNHAHTILGAEAIKRVTDAVSTNKFLSIAYNMCRSHHERWDGKGYPDRLMSTNIPLEARILAIVNSYDNFRTNNDGQQPMSHREAITRIKFWEGTHFDPELSEVFVSIENKINK